MWSAQLIDFAVLCSFALISGSAFLFTSYAKDTFPPATLTLIRLSIGSFALLLTNTAYDQLRELRLLRVREALSLGLVGLFNTAIPYTLFASALGEGVGVGIAAAMTGGAPLFAALVAAVLIPGTWQRLWVKRKVIGLLLGFVGVLLIAFHKQAVKAHKRSSMTGILLQIAGVASKALAAVLAQRHNSLHGKRNPLAQALVQASAGAVMAGVLSLALDCSESTPHALDPKGITKEGGCYNFFSDAPGKAWASAMYLAFASSCIVYVLQFFLLGKVGAVRQMLVDYCTPIVGVVEGAAFKHDWDDVSTGEVILFVVGAVLAGLGVAVLHWPDADSEEELEEEEEEDEAKLEADGDDECPNIKPNSGDPLLRPPISEPSHDSK
eukprot:Hpha_TRINITY_DN3194_c0_g1::TRINITY_DN3194_c0_g1_i1::g.96537::m.96537